MMMCPTCYEGGLTGGPGTRCPGCGVSSDLSEWSSATDVVVEVSDDLPNGIPAMVSLDLGGDSVLMSAAFARSLAKRLSEAAEACPDSAGDYCFNASTPFMILEQVKGIDP